MSYLKRFGLENFKVFKDHTEFDFAPLTILTGKNNSGKSSLIKAILTMKNNNSNFFRDLDFWEKELNIGSVDSVVNFEKSNDNIYISFSTYSSFNNEIHIKLGYYKNKNKAKITSIEVSELEGDWIFRFKKNEENITHELNTEYFNLKFDKELTQDYDTFLKLKEEHIKKDIYNNNIYKNFNKNFSENKDYLEFLLQIRKKKRVTETDNLIFISKLKRIIKSAQKTVEKRFQMTGSINGIISKEEGVLNFPFIQNELSLAMNINDIDDLHSINFLNDYIGADLKRKISDNNIFKVTNYLPPIRSNQDRLHNNSSNLSLDMMLVQIYQNDILTPMDWPFHDEIIEFLNNQLKRFEIGEEIIVKQYEGQMSAIYVKQKDKKVLLSDLGLGLSQLIPILLKIILIARFNFDSTSTPTSKRGMVYKESLFLLEEPEANLHPDFQSKLADLFVEAGKIFNIQFIVETHSEYLIRRLQYLTAKEDIKPNDVAVYYFNNPENIPEGEEQIKRITIDKYGGLSDTFGQGFYDEASNLKFDLLRLNKNQQN